MACSEGNAGPRTTRGGRSLGVFNAQEDQFVAAAHKKTLVSKYSASLHHLPTHRGPHP